MANKIIDVFAATQDFTISDSNTEVALITTSPMRVGSFARLSLSMSTAIDAAMAIRRGAGLGGDVIWDGTLSGRPCVIITDDTPSAQYTLTNSDDSSYSVTVTFTVDQVS